MIQPDGNYLHHLYVGAAIGRPAVCAYEFAGAFGEHGAFSCRATDGRPYCHLHLYFSRNICYPL